MYDKSILVLMKIKDKNESFFYYEANKLNL